MTPHVCRVAGWWLMSLFAAASLAAAPNDTRLLDAVKKADKAAVRTLLRQRVDVNISEPDGATALHWAAQQNDLETADLLIRAGANAKAANVFGVTPLWVACTNGNAAMIERLLNAGADPNAAVGEGETALMTAARTGNVDAVKVLVAHGADVHAKLNDQTALMWAAAEGHTAVVTALVDFGASLADRTGVPRMPPPAPPAAPGAPARRDVTASPPTPPAPTRGFTPFLFAVRAGRMDVVKALLEKGVNINETLPDGSGAVVLAATNAHYELAIYLVDHGADPNGAANGWSALHAVTWVRRPNFGFNPPAAVTTGNMDSLSFVKALVARGANVNARMTAEPKTGYRNALNRIGATPLMMAARLADAPLMRVLVALGADPSITNADRTTVMMVASGVGIHSPGEDPGTEEEQLECAKVALELGGDVNAVDDNGDTALHGAAYRGGPSIAQFLYDHGARTFDVKNESGWTPLRIAEGVFRTATYKESPPTAALLRQLMAHQSASAAPAQR